MLVLISCAADTYDATVACIICRNPPGLLIFTTVKRKIRVDSQSEPYANSPGGGGNEAKGGDCRGRARMGATVTMEVLWNRIEARGGSN